MTPIQKEVYDKNNKDVFTNGDFSSDKNYGANTKASLVETSSNIDNSKTFTNYVDRGAGTPVTSDEKYLNKIATGINRGKQTDGVSIPIVQAV